MWSATVFEDLLPARDFAGSVGRFLEDFKVGDVYKHWPGRTITEADNIQFSLLTMNRHPLHCDAAFAARTEFGKPLVNSGLTLAIVLGMTVDDVSINSIANLGWDEIKLIAPIFPGDTIYARTEVLDIRISKSRPGQGIEFRTQEPGSLPPCKSGKSVNRTRMPVVNASVSGLHDGPCRERMWQ
jgi:itaconyl-CoA hydratase